MSPTGNLYCHISDYCASINYLVSLDSSTGFSSQQTVGELCQRCQNCAGVGCHSRFLLCALWPFSSVGADSCTTAATAENLTVAYFAYTMSAAAMSSSNLPIFFEFSATLLPMASI